MVVIVGQAPAKETQQILVDEVEPAKAWLAQRRRHVPRPGHEQQDRQRGRVQQAPRPCAVTHQQQEQADNAAGQRQRHRTFFQHRQREHESRGAVGRRAAREVAVQEAQQAAAEQRGQQRIEQHHVRYQRHRQRACEPDAGETAGTRVGVDAAELEQRRAQREHRQRRHQACRRRRRSEYPHRQAGQPVQQRRLFDIRHAVQVRHDELPGRQHFARNLGVQALVVVA
jgi:hypothetical protein